MAERRKIKPRWHIAQQNLKRIWGAKAKPLGLTQEKAGIKMRDITQGGVGQYLRGNISLNERAVLEFARVLEIHPTEIDPSFDLLPTESQTPANRQPNLRLVPLIRRGGLSDYVGGDAVNEATEDWIPAPEMVGEDAFALRMIGASMEPDIKDGAAVIVDPNLPAEHGRVVLAYSDAAPGGVFRRYMLDCGRTYLQAINPAWPHPIEEIGDEVTIAGVAVCTFGWL